MWKTRHMLEENCPEASPTLEDFGVSFIEQGGTPRENLAPVEPESSARVFSAGKYQLNSSPLVQEAGGEGGTIAWILIQGYVQSQVLGRQVGRSFHQQQIYNN